VSESSVKITFRILQTHGVRVGQESAKRAIGFIEVSSNRNFFSCAWFCLYICMYIYTDIHILILILIYVTSVEFYDVHEFVI